jgi:hypothetical protein
MVEGREIMSNTIDDTPWVIEESKIFGKQTYSRIFYGYDLSAGFCIDGSEFFWFVIGKDEVILDEGYKNDIKSAKRAAEEVAESLR